MLKEIQQKNSNLEGTAGFSDKMESYLDFERFEFAVVCCEKISDPCPIEPDVDFVDI